MKLLRYFRLIFLIPLAANRGWAGSGPSASAPAAPAERGPSPTMPTPRVTSAPSVDPPPSDESTSGKATAPALSPADSRGKAGVIVVARKGGDYSTIQAGIEAAQKLHPRDRNHVHALVAVGGNSSISNLTLENLQTKWGFSTALLLGYSFKTSGWVNGKTIRACNLTLFGVILDVLLPVGDNDIVLEDSTVYLKGDIDTLNVTPLRKSTRYIIRRCTVRSWQGAGLFIRGPGTAVFGSCRFIGDAGRGTMRFVASLPAWEDTFMPYYRCSFLNDKSYSPGRAIDEVSEGKGFHASLDGCVYGSLGYRNPERPQIEMNKSTPESTGKKP